MSNQFAKKPHSILLHQVKVVTSACFLCLQCVQSGLSICLPNILNLPIVYGYSFSLEKKDLVNFVFELLNLRLLKRNFVDKTFGDCFIIVVFRRCVVVRSAINNETHAQLPRTTTTAATTTPQQCLTRVHSSSHPAPPLRSPLQQPLRTRLPPPGFELRSVHGWSWPTTFRW